MNESNNYSRTALHTAAMRDNYFVASELLKDMSIVVDVSGLVVLFA